MLYGNSSFSFRGHIFNVLKESGASLSFWMKLVTIIVTFAAATNIPVTDAMILSPSMMKDD